MTGSQAALGNAFTRQAQLGNHFRSQVQLGNEWKMLARCQTIPGMTPGHG